MMEEQAGKRPKKPWKLAHWPPSELRTVEWIWTWHTLATLQATLYTLADIPLNCRMVGIDYTVLSSL